MYPHFSNADTWFFLKVQISKWTYFNRGLKESAFAFQCLCASTAP